MDTVMLFLLSGTVIIFVSIACVLFFQKKHIKQKNDYHLISRIREYERLLDELKRTRIEKEMLEDLLRSRLPKDSSGNCPENEDETTLLVKTRRLK